MSKISLLLAELGIDADSDKAREIAARLSAAAKEEATEEADKRKAQKGNNLEKVESLAQEIRQHIEDTVSEADLLPGSTLNFIARKDRKSGVLIVTANDCASTGTMERSHVTASGQLVRGVEGGEMAKNSRPRATKKAA